MKFASVLLLGLTLSCTKKEVAPAIATTTTTQSTATTTTTTQTVFTQIGPTGGIISSIRFHPLRAGEVWACGDDGSGIYRSTDSGVTWNLVNIGSFNHACYAMAFDPTNANRIYIPSHFGRGLIKTTDGGTTWSVSQAGLPLFGDGRQRVYDIEVDPITPANVYAATGNGLYKSTDFGANFTLQTLTGLTTTGSCPTLEPDCNAVHTVAIVNEGGTAEIYIGEKDGEFGVKNGASNWVSALGVTTVPIWDIQATNLNVYVAFKTGAIYRFELASGAAFGTNSLLSDGNPATSGSIVTTNKIYLAVRSGGSVGADTIFAATFGSSTIDASHWGLFRSTNSGTNWTKLSSAGDYIFSLAFDPTNISTILTGSGNGNGLRRSSNGGTSWTNVDSNIYGTGSMGGFQSLTDPNHLVATYTAGGGYGANWETTNGGTTWTRFNDPAPDDGILSLWIDPRSSQKLVAGMYRKGIWRIDRGATSTWTQINATTDRIDRLIPAGTSSSTTGLYVIASNDTTALLTLSYTPDPFINGTGGLTARTGVSLYNIQPHPTNSGEAIIGGSADVYATSDFGANRTSLGLSGQAAAQGGFCGVAYDPTNPSHIVAAGCNGGLYRSLNYSITGAGTTWTTLATPIVNSSPRDILIVNRGGVTAYYLVAAKVDHTFGNGSVVGIFRSLDSGQTWARINNGITISELAWKIIPDRAAPATQILFPMWGGGFLRLKDTATSD